MKLNYAPKIIIVTPRFLPLLGGMERQVQLIADELIERNFQVVIITELLDDSPRREMNGALTVIRVGSRRYRPDPAIAPRRLGEQIRSALAIAFHLTLCARGTKLAIVRTFTLPSVVVGLLKRFKILRFPTVVTSETGGEQDDIILFTTFPAQKFLRFSLMGNDRFNALCESNVKHMRELHIPMERVSRIPNGIKASDWSMPPVASRPRRFLYFGRLDSSKGVFELVRAFSHVIKIYPDVTLSFVGRGPELQSLSTEVVRLRLDSSIRFYDAVDYADAPVVIRNHDCLVLPSYSEALPLSVLEAATAGRHLVLTDVADLRLIFGSSATFCIPSSCDSLANALLRCAEKTGKAETSRPAEGFDIRLIVGDFLNISNSL